MRTLLTCLMLTWAFSAVAADEIPLLFDKFTIDFSKSETSSYKKDVVLVQRIKDIAHKFAKEGKVFQKPVQYDDINYVLNPVLGSEKYKYHFRFNLKSVDGKDYFNCLGVGDLKLETYQIGCYLAIP